MTDPSNYETSEVQVEESQLSYDEPLDDTIPVRPERERADALTVVGLGASAGGIQALQEFFVDVPEDSGLAFVVVLHLSPRHESHLAEVLGRVTTMRVQQVSSPVRVEANHVYVIPPGKFLIIEDSTLRVIDVDGANHGERVTIDLFFRTLAAAYGPHSVGIVLSGTGADGTMGMKVLKEVGALTIAQDPTEAEQDSMPRHTIATGLVDYILPARDMARQIISYRDASLRMRLPAEAAPSPEQREDGPETAAALDQILAYVRDLTGHDFSYYKRATVLRRIGRRLQVHNLQDLKAYVNYLRLHPSEVNDLLSDLLISVTQFFRDKDAWEVLERDIIPSLFERKESGDELRAWVCGCATGEEAYSLAILLLEHAALLEHPPRIQVFATDMDADAVSHAREGIYPESIIADVSPERLRAWFYHDDGRYRVRKEVRETVLFALHDVLRDTPFSRLDLVTCRNLLIYLNRSAQERVFDIFHFAIRPEGYLMLGSSEDGASPLFAPADKAFRMYVRRALARPIPVVPALPGRLLPITTRTPPISPAANIPVHEPRQISAADLHRDLLEMYAPPSLLVDEGHQIIHMSNTVGRYLRFTGGEPTSDLLRVVHPDLRLEASTALYAAASTGQEQVRIVRFAPEQDGEARLLRLTVRPVREPIGAHGYFILIFEDITEPGGSNLELSARPEESSSDAARQLEQEIRRLQQQLRSAVEQYEASIEELKVSNEELQAVNEEMRSATEELETSKEELQSVNEELSTVNQELKNRVVEVSHVNADLHNLLTSTEIATIFLDQELRIKRYTPSAESLFNVILSDIGRPLAHVTHRLDYPQLGEDAASVLQRLTPVEREVRSQDGRHFLARVLPYRTLEDHLEGIVLTLVDITERKHSEETLQRIARADAYKLTLADALRALTDPAVIRDEAARILEEHTQQWGDIDNALVQETTERMEAATERARVEQALRESEERLRLLVDGAADYAMFMLDADTRITFWSTGAEHVFGWTEEEALGKSSDLVFTPEDRASDRLEREISTAMTNGSAPDRRWHLRKDGTRLWVDGVMMRLNDEHGQMRGFAKIARDATSEWESQEALRQAHDELEQRVSERTASLSDALVSLEAAMEERRKAETARHQLLILLAGAEEEERRRLSRELHDQTGQHLSGLILGLDTLRQSQPAGSDSAALAERLRQEAANLSAQVHQLAWDVRPPALDDMGLEATLVTYVRDWQHRHDVEADFHAVNPDGERMAPDIETTLYRVVQEALTNVARHSQASRVSMVLEYRRDVSLIIEDDGVGFDVVAALSSSKRLGLLGIRERVALVGGTLTIESAPGKGTTLIVRIPSDAATKETNVA